MMKEFFHLKIQPWGLITIAGVLACLCTLTGFIGQVWWIFDMTSHFRVQYGFGLLVVACAFASARKFKPAMFFVGFAVLNCIIVVSHAWFGRVAAKPTGQTLRVMLINVHTENQRYDLVKACILENNPDVVVLEEVNDRWLEELAGLHDNYPHSYSEPREDNFGILLLSKLPLENPEIVYLGDAEVPSVTAMIKFRGKAMTLLGTHPLPPSSRENTSLRDGQLAAIPKFLNGRKGSAVLLGDLNTTPWSHSFRRLLRESGLADSSRGFGLQASWPANLFPLRIPIDHCLLTADLKVVNRWIASDVGSDHFPLVVEITTAP
jgi:endonuclease/exonuclease/phosphatase (EEP) superfamily protein YafD